MKSLLACGFLLLTAFVVVNVSAAPKVGVLLKAKTPFWASMEKGALDAGAKLGVEVIVKAPLSENDIAVQTQLLNALAAQGVEVIAIAPSSKDALAQPIAAVAAKGIKMVILDSPLGADAPYPFVGTDQHAAGEAAGKLLNSLVGEHDVISILQHNQTSIATVDRAQGAMDILRAASPKREIHGDVYASTEKGVESERSNLLLTKYPQTKGIIATGSAGTMAMLNVLKEKHPDGSIKFVGFGFNLNPDVVAALEQGTLHGWVAQLPFKVGYQSVEAAASLLKGENPPSKIYTPAIVVTKANLKDPEVQALLSL